MLAGGGSPNSPANYRYIQRQNRGEKASFLALDGAAELDRHPRRLSQRQPREAERQGSRRSRRAASTGGNTSPPSLE